MINANKRIFYLWIICTLFIPMLICFLLFGEINLLNNNWLIAKNTPTPTIIYPLNVQAFLKTWTAWVNSLPQQYQATFINPNDFHYLTYYPQNHLVINGVAQSTPHPAQFNYPFATISYWPIIIFLSYCLIQLIALFTYHAYYHIQQTQPKITTEAYAYLFAAFNIITLLFYSNLIPAFSSNDGHYVWYLILIRIIIIISGGFIGFYLPFKLHQKYCKKYHSFTYNANLQAFQAQWKQTQKANIKITNPPIKSIKLRK